MAFSTSPMSLVRYFLILQSVVLQMGEITVCSRFYTQQERNDLVFPELPVLSSLLLQTGEFQLSNACYEEIFALGTAAGVPFLTYLQNREASYLELRPGNTVANPIVIHSVSEDSPPAGGAPSSVSAHAGSFSGAEVDVVKVSSGNDGEEQGAGDEVEQGAGDGEDEGHGDDDDQEKDDVKEQGADDGEDHGM
ncbi:hypothetical protein KC19_VG188000 [Ceratodon purpureus]|uniref:Uncharacterized protein n=1 Tax=Ceratodon purpureus TaxID=3225 RepID=A0A8T0HS34_CERPU|nr:hypothetical protein KC19_VG188000 [Ceratodon purpureus]